MRGCRNFRLFAELLFCFCLCVVRGSDSDVDTGRTSTEPLISDFDQQTIVPDSNVATTSFENTGHSTKVPTLTKQKRCNSGRLGATLTSRQNLPSDINLIPKSLDTSHIAKNLCIQCISLNKCKTAEECRACSLLCKDVVLVKDQTKAADATNVECANPTQGDGGPVVENAISRGGAGAATDAELELSASGGPVLGSRAGFEKEDACGGHLLATVTTGNVKEMILQMVGVQDTNDILSISVRATTRSGTAPVAKGPEGPEALLTIFKDELTSAILAENVDTGMQEPPTMHELFFKVLEMVQNSKPEVTHVGSTHAEESPSQTEDEHSTEHPLNEARHDFSESQTITGSQTERLRSNQNDSSHNEKSSAAQMPDHNGELDVHPLFREEDESFIPKDLENSRQSDRASSERATHLSQAHMLEENEEEQYKHSLTGKHGVDTGTQAREDGDQSEDHEDLLPQVAERSEQSDRLGSTHEQKSSLRQMEDDDDDNMLPRFPLAEKPQGFVVPQLANPAIIEGPPLPGMVLGATHKEKEASEVVSEIQNASPNNRHTESVDSTEEDLPRYNLADHEGSLVLQVSNISTIGLPSPIGNSIDDSFIPDMEADASEQKLVTATDKNPPRKATTGFEAKEMNDVTISGTKLGGNINMEAKMSPKQTLNSVERDDTSGTILGVMSTTESKDSNTKLLGDTSLNKIGDFTVHKVQAAGSESIDKSEKLSESTTNAAKVDMAAENPKIETLGLKRIVLATSPKLESTESIPLEIVRDVPVNEIGDSRSSQVTISNGTVALDGSTIGAAARVNQAGSRFESISDSKSDNSIKSSLEKATKRIEFQEGLPIGSIVGSADNSIMLSKEDKALSGKPMITNLEGDITDIMDHEAFRKINLDTVEDENTDLTLGVGTVADEEPSISKNEALDNSRKIIVSEPETTIHLKSSPAETMASAAHGNDWDKLVSLSTTSPKPSAAEMQENDMIHSKMKSSHLKMDQSSATGILTDKEVTAAENPFLGSTTQTGEASSEIGNVMGVRNQALQDLVADLPAESLEEEFRSTLEKISERKSQTGTMLKAHPEKMVEESSEIVMPGDGLTDTQLEEVSKTTSVDDTGKPSSRTCPTDTLVGTPLENRNEIPATDKPTELSSMTTAGAKLENKSGTADTKPLSAIEESFGKLSSTNPESPANAQFIAQESAVRSPLIHDSTIMRLEEETMEKASDKLFRSSSTSRMVMNVVVPDEFLGWSKPSDNPTTINIVIPPKAVPQESANIEKADLREGGPEDEDEPRGHGEFAGHEIMNGDGETDNREAVADGDFEEENQVREFDNEQDSITEIDSRNGEFDDDPQLETELRDSDNEAPDDEEQIEEDDSSNNIDRDENEEETPEVRDADAEDNQDDGRGQPLEENEESDIDTGRRTSIGIKQPQSFSRLEKLMHSMQSPQERIANVIRKGKDRSNVGAQAPSLTEEGDSSFPKKLVKTESKIGKMLEKFRDRLHKNRADGSANTVSSSAREKFANQDVNTFENPNNPDASEEDHTDLENDGRLSEQQQSRNHDDADSRLEEQLDHAIPEQPQDLTSRTPDTLNQEVVHTTYKSPDFKLPLRNSARLGNGRLSSDSQLKVSEDHELVGPPISTQSQGEGQQVFKDSQNLSKPQTDSQLRERMNVANDLPFSFTPGEDPTLQEPDRELALSGITQSDPASTTRSTIFGDHFPSTPSLSEIISSAKDKFRKTFEENAKTLVSSSRPVVGSANQRESFRSTSKFQEAPGFDGILGDSTSTSGISSSNIQSPDEVRTFQQAPARGGVLGNSNIGNSASPVDRIKNSRLGSIDGANVGHTIQEIGQNTGRVIQETSNILGDTIRNGKQGLDNIFKGVNDLASMNNGQVSGRGLGNRNPATLRYKLPNSGITDTLSQSFNKDSIGDFDNAGKVISDATPLKSSLDNFGIPRANWNRFGQVNLDTVNQESVKGIGLTPHVTVQPSEQEEAHGRKTSGGSSGFTGLTLPITVNRIEPLSNRKPITVSEVDMKDPTNVDNLHPLGSPQSELIVEPPGLDSSDSSEEGLRADQAGFPKQQAGGAPKQNQPVVTEGLPHIGMFNVHTPFSIPRNINKPTANPISNFEAAKNALLKLQQLTGRLRKKDGIGKGTATSEEQPSVTDVVKVLQEISKEVISTAENVSKSKAKNIPPSEPNVVGSQILENSWENLQPFLPRDSHPLTITKPIFPHHVVGLSPTTTLKTPVAPSGATPLLQRLLDRTSTYYSTLPPAKVDNNIQKAIEPITNQLGNTRPSSTMLPFLIDNKIKEQHQILNTEPTRLPEESSGTGSNGLVHLPSGFVNGDTNRVGMIQSNQQAKRPIPFGLDVKLPQSINDMLTPKPEEVASPVKDSANQDSGAIETSKLPHISDDLSSATMSSSSSDRVESRQPQDKMNNQAVIESSPVLAARHQNDIAISPETPRDIYFVGTGMKLPLQMVKKEGGEVHLSVDIDKLCSCKNNSSCAKNQSADESELKNDLVVDGSSSNGLAVDGPTLGVEKSVGDGFAKRNTPTHRSLRDVEDRYAVEWEIEEPEEVYSEVRRSTDTEDSKGEHRIEIEIDDPVIIPKSSSSHTQGTSNVKLLNRFSTSSDDAKLKNVKTIIASQHITTSDNTSNNKPDTDRNTIKKISDKVFSSQAVDIVMEPPKITQDKKNDTANIFKTETDNDDKAITHQTDLNHLNVKKAGSYQYSSPFRRLHYPELSSKNPLVRTESVGPSTEKSTYLSNFLKKLRSRLPTQEPRSVNTNLRSASHLFGHRTRNQGEESDEGPKPIKLSNRFKDLNGDRYSNLALRNRLFPTLGRQKEPLAKLEETADEKDVLPIKDEDKESQDGGIVKNVLNWFKNLNNKQKR
nr:unnamed protein product [Callosobruchus chinensis]